jgi:hypothetical protein
MRATFFLVGLLAGCRSSDALVVVTVTANQTVANVASLSATLTVGTTTRMHQQIAVQGGMLPSSPATSFGVLVATSFGSSMQITVDAVDASGAVLASGQGQTQLTAGKRSDVTITLLPGGRVCRYDDPGSEYNKNCTFAP